jgi:hypothetical protein
VGEVSSTLGGELLRNTRTVAESEFVSSSVTVRLTTKVSGELPAVVNVCWGSGCVLVVLSPKSQR